jgi:ssDNA-binding Zn-finger/Zn-ribbon topoisomerase 1
MCNICGKNCGKGGALKKHVEGSHGVECEAYTKCFYTEAKNILANAWDDSVSTSNGQTVITHVLARRFVGDTGPRGATRSVPVAPA